MRLPERCTKKQFLFKEGNAVYKLKLEEGNLSLPEESMEDV